MPVGLLATGWLWTLFGVVDLTLPRVDDVVFLLWGIAAVEHKTKNG